MNIKEIPPVPLSLDKFLSNTCSGKCPAFHFLFILSPKVNNNI